MAQETLGMAPRRCKYSRASFLFPEQQPAPYREGFDQEARFLRTHFGASPPPHPSPTGPPYARLPMPAFRAVSTTRFACTPFRPGF
jgi:hypothetical protein